MKSLKYLVRLLKRLSSRRCRKVDEAGFTKLYSERMKELNPNVVINELGTLQIDYSLPGTEQPAKSQTVFLDNAYR